jgi:hypothetical protein
VTSEARGTIVKLKASKTISRLKTARRQARGQPLSEARGTIIKIKTADAADGSLHAEKQSARVRGTKRKDQKKLYSKKHGEKGAGQPRKQQPKKTAQIRPKSQPCRQE